MKHECEKISQLASGKMERKLSFRECLIMNLHFVMCEACKQYQQNLLKLYKTLNVKRKEMSEGAVLPEDKRKGIEQTLQELSKYSK